MSTLLYPRMAYAPHRRRCLCISCAPQNTTLPTNEADCDAHRVAMESDDLTPSVPRKRYRSVSPSPVPSDTMQSETPTQRIPKRLRRSHDIPAYDAPVEEHARRTMATANPLSRRVLKQEAKKARRAATRAMNLQKMSGGGMEIDDEGGLGATFLAGATAMSGMST